MPIGAIAEEPIDRDHAIVLVKRVAPTPEEAPLDPLFEVPAPATPDIMKFVANGASGPAAQKVVQRISEAALSELHLDTAAAERFRAMHTELAAAFSLDVSVPEREQRLRDARRECDRILSVEQRERYQQIVDQAVAGLLMRSRR